MVKAQSPCKLTTVGERNKIRYKRGKNDPFYILLWLWIPLEMTTKWSFFIIWVKIAQRYCPKVYVCNSTFFSTHVEISLYFSIEF